MLNTFRSRVGGAIYGAFQKINAATQLMGVVPLANGGTGSTSLSGAGIEQTANKGAANGYAGLNSSGYVPTAQQGSGSANSASVLFGNQVWQALTRALVPEVATVSAATALTISVTTSCWVFNGSSPATWTLPTVSGNAGVMLIIENRGTAAITITAAGSDHIWRLASVSTMTVAPNGSLILVNDGTYWNALSLDLLNNAASLTGLPFVTPTLTGYYETVQAMGTVGSTATIPALSGGTYITATLTAGTTTTFTMPAVSPGASFILELKQNSTPTGNASFTSVVWPIVGAPTPTTTANYVDLIMFVANGAGTAWRGSYVQGYAS